MTPILNEQMALPFHPAAALPGSSAATETYGAFMEDEQKALPDSPTASEIYDYFWNDESEMDDFTRFREERSRYFREHAAELKVKNRRKRYLDMHPHYFDDFTLELGNPKLHYFCIRRFQTATERETAGHGQVASEKMASSLWRAEIRKEGEEDMVQYTVFEQNVAKNNEAVTKEEAREWWVDEMTQRFLCGKDRAFDYKTVDENHKYDDPEEERDIQDAYFDSMESDFDSDGEGKEKVYVTRTLR